MFSFFKKLFKVQKPDENIVKTDHIELSNGPTRFQNVEIKGYQSDKTLVKIDQQRPVNNESKISPTSFQNIKIKVPDTKSNNECKSIKNDEKHQPSTQLNGFKGFSSNEITSASSRTNFYASLKKPITTVYRSQRQCSKLATKKIAVISDRLALGSDESDSEIDECSEEEQSSKKDNLIQGQKRRTVRLCPWCKTLKTFFGDVTKIKYCDQCKIRLLYLCTTCEAKHYASVSSWHVHESLCNQKKNSMNLVDERNQSIIHECPDCHLKVFDKNSMKYKKIKIEDAKSQNQDSRFFRNAKNTKGKVQKASGSKELVIVDKQAEDDKFARYIRRYCEKCRKRVQFRGERKNSNNMKCQSCSRLLQFLCDKCDTTYITKADIINHLKFQCCQRDKKCHQCTFRFTNKNSLYFHLKVKHNWSPTMFQCDMCAYKSLLKCNLKQHIQQFHLTRPSVEFCCKICSFKSLYPFNLQRHLKKVHSMK